jgi:hypothetical protein
VIHVFRNQVHKHLHQKHSQDHTEIYKELHVKGKGTNLQSLERNKDSLYIRSYKTRDGRCH